MSREEILEQLNYKGKYTKDVKKKLNKLLKKYHPDNNKNDKMTILTLYQIKKELEDGTLKYDNLKKDNKSNNNEYQSLLKMMINKLILKRDRIDKKMEILYEKINDSYEIINNKQDEISYIDLEVERLREEVEQLKKRDTLETILIILMVLFIMFMIIFKKIFFVLFFFIFIILEIYYLYLKKSFYLEAMAKLKKTCRIKDNVNEEFDVLDKNVRELLDDEKKLKNEKNRVNNDIQFYSHELSKIDEKVKNKEKNDSYENEYKDVYVKK